MRALNRLLVVGACAVTLAAPLDGQGYVRTRTKVTCRPLRWAQTCIFLQPDAELLRDELPAEVTLDAIKSAIRSWNERLTPSSFLQLHYLPPTDSRESSQTDRLGLLKFRFGSWCRPAKDSSSMPVCFDPSATAVTTVSFLNKPSDPDLDGNIVDTDIDFNAVSFRFVDASQPATSTDRRSPVDLWNVLTHELGHVMGLDHTCVIDSSAGGCMTEQKGGAVLSCAALDGKRLTSQDAETAYEAAMYPTSVAGEFSRRVPTSDDLAGVIISHPASADPQSCTVPSVVSGCEVAESSKRGGAPLWASLLGVLAAASLLLRVRRS